MVWLIGKLYENLNLNTIQIFSLCWKWIYCFFAGGVPPIVKLLLMAIGVIGWPRCAHTTLVKEQIKQLTSQRVFQRVDFWLANTLWGANSTKWKKQTDKQNDHWCGGYWDVIWDLGVEYNTHSQGPPLQNCLTSPKSRAASDLVSKTKTPYVGPTEFLLHE